MRCIPLWERGRRPRPARRLDSAIQSSLEPFLSAIAIGDDNGSFRTNLQQLAPFAQDGSLPHALGTNDALELTLQAMRSTPQLRTPQTPLPAATIADAANALTLLEHFLRPLALEPVQADLCHTSSNGLSALVAMAAKWAHGTPFLLTEHGVYLRERFIEYGPGKLPQVQRAFLLGFYQRLSLAAYQMADAIAPGSDYNRRWLQANGADVNKIEPIHNGIDVDEFRFTAVNTEHPTLVWVGRIDPLKDVKTLLRAFARVRIAIPAARLRIFGGTPKGNERYLRECLGLRDDLGLETSATFEGRVRSISDAYLSGDVVVATSISEGFPYAVLEAMASGRAMIATDVGGVNEAIDDTGILVPPQDDVSLAEACIRLLRDPLLREVLATRGRDRVRARFMVELSNERFAELYDDLVDAARRCLEERP
jgi:glycosyltransferase involved in cell wall biosynthesis